MNKPDPMSVEGLVKQCIKPYLKFGVPYDDLYQAGMLGAIIAADHYDETKGCYTTIVTYWVRDELNKICSIRKRKIVDGLESTIRELITDLYVPTDPSDIIIEDNESDPMFEAILESNRDLLNSLLSSMKSDKHREFIIEKLTTDDVIKCANKYLKGDRDKAVKRCGEIFRTFIKNAKEALSENRDYITYHGKAAPNR